MSTIPSISNRRDSSKVKAVRSAVYDDADGDNEVQFPGGKALAP